MINNNIIFEPSITGHRMEYLNSLYHQAIQDNNNYIFVVPEEFKEQKSKLEWPQSENIVFQYISKEEAEECENGNILKTAKSRCECIRKFAKKWKADNVFLISMIATLPFLPFYLPKKTKASGIIYKIYLYEEGLSIIRRIINYLLFWLLANKKSIKNIFILNDPKSTEVFNIKYKTNKFKYLTDPIPNIDRSKLENLRKELRIPLENKVYLQFGTLDRRKNTLNILRAFELMNDDELKDKTIIFSGRIENSIKEEFYSIIDRLNKRIQIIILEGFISYDLLNNLCYTADVLLTIYNNVEMSSGCIGYAAFFNIPTIATSKGLLGQLIKDNKLGYTIESNSPEDIKGALLKHIELQENNYCNTHQVKDFCETIFKFL